MGSNVYQIFQLVHVTEAIQTKIEFNARTGIANNSKICFKAESATYQITDVQLKY